MSAKNLIGLRSLLEQYIKASRTTGSILRSIDLIEGFRKDNEEEIRAVSKLLENSAILKLINDIGTRKHHKLWSDQQVELFSQYSGIPQTITVISIKDGKKIFVKKIIPESTVQELEDYLKRLTDSKGRKVRHSPLKLLLNDVSRKAKSIDEKIGDVVKTSRKEVSKKSA